MCAIIGAATSEAISLSAGLSALRHRGPDASAIWNDAMVTLGHNRLSIIDLDARSNQPFFDAAGKIGIVYNGEIYNYKQLRDELRELGHTFRTESDTEVVVEAYAEWGVACLERFEGMFAFALYDVAAAEVLLATDHQSIKPVFYALRDGDLFFASEIKGVTALYKERGWKPDVDTEALDTYFAFGQIPAPATLFTGVRRLAPAQYVSFDLATRALEEQTYVPRMAEPHEVAEAIEHAVASHLVADVPVGVFFSGGVDSSLIAALLKKQGVNLQAFCVEIADRPEDAVYAKRVSTELDFPYKRFSFDIAEFESIYTEVVSRIDEPFADSSIFPTYYVAKRAREDVTVALSGEGGDEFFFGYPRSRDLLSLRTARLDVGVGLLDRLYGVLPAFRGKNKLFERLFVFFRKPVAFYLLTMSPSKSLMSFAQWRSAKRIIAQKVTEAIAMDAALYLPNILLRKADLATMFASLEARVPLLDVGVVAAARTIVGEAEKSSELKPVLKKILEQYVSKDIVHRKKTGFGLRTRSYFDQSVMLQKDFATALAFLEERGYVRIRVPDTETLLCKYPNVCWQLLFLYHAIKNASL